MTVISLPQRVTRCQFCGAALSPQVTLTIAAAGAYCIDRSACAERAAAP